MFENVTNRLTNSGGAQQDELITANAEEIAALQEDVGGLQAALENRGPIETSGSTKHLAPEDCEDLGQRIIDEPNARFVLEPGGEYPIKTEPRLTDPDQPHRELAIEGNGAKIVVADKSIRSFGWFGRKRGGAFEKLSLQDLTLVVDPEQGYDAGWGRYWIDDRVENANLSIEGRRDYYDRGRGRGEDDDRESTRGDKFGYHCCITTESGTGVHWNIDLRDGDTPGGEQFSHAIGASAEAEHVGTNFWLGCSVEEWWDNGFYVKDGTGRNVLIGCVARNCGGAGIRLGENDVAIACSSTWDLPMDPAMVEAMDRYPDDHDDYDGLHGRAVPNGVCLDADDGGATTVRGFTAVRRTGYNDTVRIWTGDGITYENLQVENHTSQYAVRISGEAVATAALEGVEVTDYGDDSIRGAAVGIRRKMTVLEDCTIDVSEGGGNRAAVEIDGGAEVTIARGQYKGADTHAFRVHGGTEHLELSGNVKLWNGVHLYEDGPSVLGIDGVNCYLVDEMWPGEDPEDVVGDYAVGLMNKGGPSPELPTADPSGNSGNGGGSGRSCEWIEAEGIETPVFELESEDDGPTVAVVGGVYGDEDPGYRIAGRLASMRPQRGTLRVIPRANPDAIENRSRNAGYDLNRQFPRGGSPQTDLARELWAAVEDADVIVDLHRSGSIYPSGNGQALYSSAEGKSEGQQACVQFNARYVDPGRWGQDYKFSFVPNQSSGSGINSLVRYAASEGRAAHLIEVTTKGTAMERPVEWLYAIVHELLWQHGINVE